jgi:hypothetical protein
LEKSSQKSSYDIEAITEALNMLKTSPGINKAIVITDNNTKISAYYIGDNIIRIDINNKDAKS